MSSSTISRVLKRLGLHPKKTFHATQKQTEQVQNLRRDYNKQITTLRVKNLVFVDEAVVNLGMTRQFRRALSAQTAYGTRPQQRGKNVSLIAVIDWMITPKSLLSNHFSKVFVSHSTAHRYISSIALRGVIASTAILEATEQCLTEYLESVSEYYI
ncbi:MAG: hypothetical protein V7K88_29800 [Nostoc sp.]|uniref:hypothetical protein n=1 Tax=Nostoc sp. TaxID=1180 RepID=UPI002FF62633